LFSRCISRSSNTVSALEKSSRATWKHRRRYEIDQPELEKRITKSPAMEYLAREEKAAAMCYGKYQ
jgi:hypothetical protein